MSDIKQDAINEFNSLKFLIDLDSSLSNTVWQSNLSTGKTLEFVSLLALIREISEAGLDCEIVEFFKNKPELFYLRNEIPCHHEAQAGHDMSVSSNVSLYDRFKAAILPRATFSIEEEKYMVFREGNPLHFIYNFLLGKPLYKERPDLAIVKGKLSISDSAGGVLRFTHLLNNAEKIDIDLSVKNTNLLPIKKFSMSKNYNVNTSGVVECSVSKTQHHVDNQLALYSSLFKNKEKKPFCLFVHGKQIEASNFPTVKINMNELVASISTWQVRSVLSDFIKSQSL